MLMAAVIFTHILAASGSVDLGELHVATTWCLRRMFWMPCTSAARPAVHCVVNHKLVYVLRCFLRRLVAANTCTVLYSFDRCQLILVQVSKYWLWNFVFDCHILFYQYSAVSDCSRSTLKFEKAVAACSRLHCCHVCCHRMNPCQIT